jgi:TonB family protein
MTRSWKQCEGEHISEAFPLHQYLGGKGNQAVFLTEYRESETHKAAIKIVLGDADSTDPQLHRWSLVANLSHPHLIRIFTMGRSQLGDESLIYLVMEYANENLSQVIPTRPLTAEEALEMLKPVVNALEYVHAQGFSHGHVTPANILAVNGRLGISSDNLCPIGEVSGSRTPDAYTPPEVEGLSPAGDVWSLGMTLVEALTQLLPARRLTGQHEPVVPETLLDPFLEIARRCLRSDPTSRWTVTDIAARLNLSEAAGQERKPEERRATSRKWVSAVAASLALALSTILIAPRLLNRQTNSPLISESPSVQHKQIRVQPRPERKPTMPQDAAPVSSRVGEAEPPAAKPKTSASDFAPGEVFHQVLPEVPSKARKTIQGKVKVSVRVHIDPSGGVTLAELDSPGPSKYFAQLALEAARRWKFAPAKATHRKVANEWILRFEFFRTNTKVVPCAELAGGLEEVNARILTHTRHLPHMNLSGSPHG